VENPANPESIILSTKLPFDGVQAEFKQVIKRPGYITVSVSNQKESKVMAETLEVLQDTNKRLEATLKAAQDKVDSLEKQLKELDQKSVQARIVALEADVKAHADKVTALTAQVKTEQDARLESEKKLDEALKNLKLADDKLAEVQAQEVNRKRIDKWINHTGVTAEIAGKAVNRSWVKKLNEEEFDELVKDQPAKANVVKPDKSGKKNADAKVLETAQADTDTALKTGDGDAIDKTRASIKDYMNQMLKANRKHRVEEVETK